MRIVSRVTLLILACVLPGTGLAGQPTPSQAPTALLPGTPVERASQAGDADLFELTVPAGTAVKVDVYQRGADVKTTLTPRPGGTPLEYDNADIGAIGREVLLWAAPPDAAVAVTIAVRTTRVRQAGRYVLRADVIDAADGLEGAVKALNATVPFPTLDKKALAAELAAALPAAGDVWTRIGERELAARTQIQLGRLLLLRLQRPADALTAFSQALEIHEALGDDVAIVETMLHKANALRQLGRLRDAIAINEAALARSGGLDAKARAIVRSDLARVLGEQGEFEASLPYAREAVATFKEAGEIPDALVSLERLAQLYVGLRRLDDALEALSEALTLAPRYGKPGAQLSLTRTIGNVHSGAGDEERAMAAFRRALELAPKDSNEAMVLVLDIARQYNRRGDYVEARDLLEPLLARVPPQQENVWAAIASELGANLTSLGDPQRGRELQLKALAIVVKGGSIRNEMIVQRDLAHTDRALGDLAAARGRTARMIEIQRALPDNPLKALVLREQARDERLAGDLPRARAFMDRALEAIESERDSQRAQAFRTAFAGNTIGYYDDSIDLAMAMHAAEPGAGHDGRALAIFERSRARSLSDLLANASVDIRADVAPAITAQQRELQRQIAAADAGIRAAGSAAGASTRVAALEGEIDGLTRQLAVLDAQAKASSPRYGAATRPALGSIAEIQALLDDDTVLIAYACALRKSWGWAVTRTGVRAFPLPPAATIDAAARRVVDATRKPAAASAGSPADTGELERARDALGELVLGPIADALGGDWRARRLAFVTSGPLEYVPFAALSLPAAARTEATTARWLADAHEIVLLPSASVLAQLREPKPGQAAPVGQLVVVADPVYSASDPRVATNRSREATLMARATTRGSEPAAPTPSLDGELSDADRALTRSGATRGDFARLVFSRQEARELAGLAGPDGAVQVLDFDASVETLRSPLVARARRLHVATHGILDTTRPERSGLVLSLVDKRGQAHDGVLRLNDIFGLSLSAELVVLSGCETGLGRQMRGEGLVGLTRAFMYAGAPRVVSSLWQVDDQATAQLMTRFYRHMLQGGQRPAAALRAAQLELARDPRWAAPYFWAGFVIQGDWR